VWAGARAGGLLLRWKSSEEIPDGLFQNLPALVVRTLADEGRQGETVVIIEPSQPRELAWLRASAYGLSERERAVMDCVAQGASTKEIAGALCISEYTVQEHLSHIFDKVGVRGRQALVQRLFFDHLAPGMLTAFPKVEHGALG
jgi:DNA-binding NarL/FixJ family response regulator